MPNYIPKAEQIDVLNEKLTAINDTLKKKNDFTDAVKNLKDVTTKAEEATEKATTAAESVVSPTAKVTKSGDTATITITDKSGTTSAEVVDGSDAEVTKDNVVAALGYEPAEKEGNYELIETITLTEDTSSIVRTAEPDGTPYNFNGIVIYMTSKTSTNNSWIYLYGNNSEYCAYGKTSNAYNYPTQIRAELRNGIIHTQSSVEPGYNVYAGWRTTALLAKVIWTNNIIDYIKISASSNILSGSTIKIYGLRA